MLMRGSLRRKLLLTYSKRSPRWHSNDGNLWCIKTTCDFVDMNFDSERNKPIFVTRRSTVTFLNASGILSESLANCSVLATSLQDDFLVKSAAAKRLPSQTLLTVDNSTRPELVELVARRLEIDANQKFRFLDGKEFNGAQAAVEVRSGTQIGNYFLEVEKETLRIIQDAFRRGQIA